ncbi:amidase (plasmid) [Streptomyces sp. BI20]|uniref:amidase n=1 Tax=Streptomyces sp. BI20 TaxID=3403460 RepID=UPI003C787816
MPVEPPSSARLDELAARAGFALSAAERDAIGAVSGTLLDAWGVVERLHAEHSPAVPVGREHHRPDPAENPWGAWCVRTRLRERDAGPLAGLTVAVKDNVAVAGVPMTNGSAVLAGHTPAEDATVVRRLLDAGATITGTATCEDLCLSGGSHTSVGGPVRNPWDPARTSGGSSSGSAALVAAGEVDLALGGDQAGSIRIPAAFCGVVGLKPTHGLIPYTGAFPIETTLDHLGPLTRTVRGAALALGVLAGEDPGRDPRRWVHHRDRSGPPDPVAALERGADGLRVGLLAEGFGLPGVSDPAVDARVRETVHGLTAEGVGVSEVSVPFHALGGAVWTVVAVEGATRQLLGGSGYGANWEGRYDPALMTRFGRRLPAHLGELPATVKLFALLGGHTLDLGRGGFYGMARNLLPVLRAAYDTALAEVDVLALPTVPFTAPPLPPAAPDPALDLTRALESVPNTAQFNATGHPALSVPAGLVDGLPTGVMLVSRHGADDLCLRIGAAVERLAGGFPSPP